MNHDMPILFPEETDWPVRAEGVHSKSAEDLADSAAGIFANSPDDSSGSESSSNDSADGE